VLQASAIASACLLACSGSDGAARNDTASVSALPASESGGPAPAPGTLVFRSDRDQAGVGDLYLMDLDGGNVRRLTNGGDYTTPAWSPDGASIAFRRVVGLDAEIGLLSPAGDEPVILVSAQDPELRDRVLTWSGDELMYASREGGPQIDLWVVSRSGGQRRPLFPEPAKREELDAARADARLALTWNPGEMPDDHDLWLATGPDDPAPQNLTQGRVYIPSGPRWSPDGNTIAFWGYARTADGGVEGLGDHADGLNYPQAEIFVMDVGTREITRLTQNDVDDIAPVWTPDGTSLLVSSPRDGDEDIWRIPVAAPDAAVNLTEDSDVPSSDSMPDCFWPARVQ
jgi:Tol biopolymer transport system component